MLVACKALVWSALLWQGAGAWMRVGASPRGSLMVLKSAHTTLPAISVFDGVLDCGDADTLSAFETSCAALGSTHWLYSRSLNKEENLDIGVVGTLLEQLLTSLQDDAPFVELWRREDWMVLDAHRDVDEVLARRTDESYALRCPSHAHVLYVSVGKEVQGPTCLWLESASTEPDRHIETLVTVPARSGRLLRFPGDAIHSVPRPPLCYLDPEEGGTNLEIHSRTRNELESSPELRRSVLLFNTWHTPPAEVRALPPPPVREITARSRLLRARQDWKDIPISSPPSAPEPASHGLSVHLKLGVLGDRRRRFAPDTAWLHLYSHRGVKAALEAKEAVYSTALGQNKTA